MREDTSKRFDRLTTALVEALATNDIMSLTSIEGVTINVIVSEDLSTDEVHDVMLIAAQTGAPLTSRQRCDVASQLLLEACTQDQECEVHGLALSHTLITTTFNHMQRTKHEHAEDKAIHTADEILDKMFGKGRKGDDDGRVH